MIAEAYQFEDLGIIIIITIVSAETLPFNPSAVWDEIKLIGDRVSLYHKMYDVERVRKTLRLSKLVSVHKLKIDTAFKWIMNLEGNQTVLFKPRLQ